MAAGLAATTPAWAHKGFDFVSVNTTADSGRGSLRDAINLANDDSESQIVFRIPTTDKGYNPKTGVFTINLKSPLPPVTGADTVFDGLAQTLAFDSNKKGPEITISGKALPKGTHGFVIQGTRCEVKGLTIADFSGNGIVITGAEAIENLVQSSVIARCGGSGVVISDGATGNRIGIDESRGKAIDEEFRGLYDAPANVFINNGEDAIRVSGANTFGNSLRGNIFYGTKWLPIRLRTEGDSGLRTARVETVAQVPNSGQKPPQDLTWNAEARTLTGTIHGEASTDYLVDIYVRESDSPSEPWRFGGFVKAKTDAQGKASWSFAAKSPKPEGVIWGATLTTLDGNTSEMVFSK